jgi:hydroxyacylglutathione hydrolase
MTDAKDGIHSYEEIAPQTYRIDEKGIVNTYLVIGKEKALLIDTGLGVGNLLETVREITPLPVVVCLTHRHCDHAGGRNWFKEYYVHEGDKPLIYRILSSRFACKQLLKMNKITSLTLSKMPNHAKVRYFKDDFTLELGGREIRIAHVPGHTEGSVVYFDDQAKIMFTGDDVNPYLWMQLPGCTCLSKWLVGAKAILGYLDQGSYTPYAGHDKGKLTREGIAGVIAVGEEILAKKPQFEGKTLDYPFDKTVFPRICVAKKGIR